MASFSIPVSGIILSSSLPANLEIDLEGAGHVDVKISVGSDLILEGRYWGEGKIILPNLRLLVNEHLSAWNAETQGRVHTVSIVLGDADKDGVFTSSSVTRIAVVYCSRVCPMADGEFFLSRFLSLTESKSVPPKAGPLLLWFLGRKGDSMRADITFEYRNPDGSKGVRLLAWNPNNTVHTTAVLCQEIDPESITESTALSKGLKPCQINPERITVQIGQRVFTYLIDDSLTETPEVLTANCFGLEEKFWLRGSLTLEDEQERDGGSMMGTRYSLISDRTETLTYHSAPLMEAEVEEISEICSSPMVMLAPKAGEPFLPVIVTDSKIETEEQGALSEVEADFTLTDDTPSLPRGTMYAPRRIFSDEYNNTYC